jgi:hypothetical protein
MSRQYVACKQKVLNRGTPPVSFLNALLDWAEQAPDEIFAENDNYDIYSSVAPDLGPWSGLLHRKAVMLEVLRVLAGFESSWNWNEGIDTNNPGSKTPCTGEAGIFQCSGDSMGYDSSLKRLMREVSGKTDCTTFRMVSKSNHRFAIEYCARLLRLTVNHHGPVKRKEINPWLRRNAAAEFQRFFSDQAAQTDTGVDLTDAGSQQILDTLIHIKPPNGRQEIEAMFGNPINKDGTLNEAWEEANIRKIAPPDKWQLYYQDDDRGLVPVSGVRMHRLLNDLFVAALDDIWDFARQQIGGRPSDETIRAWLHTNRLDQHGGGFNFRKITGGTKLSLHGYGIAIDWDPDHNPRQKPLNKTLPDWWYEIWGAHGWHDGRRFRTPDPMHVQFATGA